MFIPTIITLSILLLCGLALIFALALNVAICDILRARQGQNIEGKRSKGKKQRGKRAKGQKGKREKGKMAKGAIGKTTN